MSTARYVHWQDGEMWLGYFEEFPDYLTEGETVEALEENLRDLYRDLTSGEISVSVKSPNFPLDEADRLDPQAGGRRMRLHPARWES